MPIQGLRTSANFVTNEAPESWREGLLMLEPNGNVPLTALTSLMKPKIVDNPTYHWWEKTRPARRIALHATSGDLTTTNTTITLASGDDNSALQFKSGDCFLVEQTGEKIEVTGDPSTAGAMVVLRARQGSTAATVDANGAGINPNLLYIGSVNEEGSLAPTGIAYDAVEQYNYTQIFRDTLEFTGTAMATTLRTTEQVAEAKRETLVRHAQGMERAFFFGGRSSFIKNGKPARSLGGILWRLAQYDAITPSDIRTVDAKADYASGVTMDGLEEYLRRIFQYGSNEKMAFCGNVALLAIQKIVRKNSHMNFEPSMKEYGMNVSVLTCPTGRLVLKNHPMFNEIPGGTTTGTAYYGVNAMMVVLDMKSLTYVSLKGRDTKYEPKLEADGTDGMQSGFISEVGLEIAHPSTHFVIKNLAVGKVD